MKRGISELISYVLLVGFVVAVGTFIIIWSINQFKDVNLDDPTQNCPQISISLENYCIYTDPQGMKFVNLSVYNRGSFNITKFTIFKRETGININDSFTKEVGPPLGMPLKPRDTMPYYQDLKYTVSEVSEITITPWITQNISCSDQKLVITKAEDLNRQC